MRITSLFAVAALAMGSISNGAIVLQTSELELEPGVIQYTVSAVGDAGEELNTFSNLELTGNLHQVYNLTFGGPQPTPTADSHGAGGAGFGAGNEAYDTFFKLVPPFAFSNTSLTESVGDTSTTGGLTNLPVQDIFGNAAPTGFSSDPLVMDPIDGAITLTTASTSIEFLQVVLAAGTQAELDLRVDGPGVFETFTDFVIGGATMVDPMLVGDPAGGSTIDLTADFTSGTDGGIDIALSNGGDGDLGAIGADITNDALGIFSAIPSPTGVDVVLDVSGLNLASIAPGPQTADLTVTSANGGSLVYTVSASIPEPASAGLVSLVLAGLAGVRRRG
ncbi:MAG: PEP-CTERM sorting domain-containing protein [Planctomycetota bacterium]